MEETLAHLTTRQIRQLIEIDTVGPGIRSEVQALITRLTSGGVGPKSDDPRIIRAKALFDKGFGGEVSFEEYLAGIPAIPKFPASYSERFPELLLVDARLPITMQCKLLGVEFPGDDSTYEDFDSRETQTEPVYWIRAQNGVKNRNRSVRDCRKSFAEDELGLTAYEGLALRVHSPEALKKGYAIDLPGSVHRDSRDYAAYLYWFGERPKLFWIRGGYEDPYYGSASRGK